jgi:hypothetical protein
MVFRLMVSLRLSMAGGLPSKVTRGLIVLWLGRHGKPPINNRACIAALDRRTKGEDGSCSRAGTMAAENTWGTGYPARGFPRNLRPLP